MKHSIFQIREQNKQSIVVLSNRELYVTLGVVA
jgi:hypothetical protein